MVNYPPVIQTRINFLLVSFSLFFVSSGFHVAQASLTPPLTSLTSRCTPVHSVGAGDQSQEGKYPSNPTPLQPQARMKMLSSFTRLSLLIFLYDMKIQIQYYNFPCFSSQFGFMVSFLIFTLKCDVDVKVKYVRRDRCNC